MKYFIGIFLLCMLFSCKSDQELHLDKINDLQFQLVDTDLKTNLEISQELVIELENYLSKYQDSINMPDHYMQLADLYTHSLQLPIKGLYFFQKVNTDFPNYEKAPLALFYQGFVLENYMGQLQQAKSVYESFLTSYPKHELSETVRLSIQQLGVPLEDLVKQFENKN